MAKRTERPSDTETADRVRVPPPVPGGTGTEESLGRWMDDLVGDRRARAAASRNLAMLVMTDDEKPDDPPPSEPPPPVPGGTEAVTKGGRPNR
jgi:hypothetical protein